MPISVTATSIDVVISQRGLLSKYPPAPRDTTLDSTFDCQGEDAAGNEYQGVPILEVTVHGDWLGRRWAASPILVTSSIAGSWSTGGVWAAPTGVIPLSVALRGTFAAQSVPGGGGSGETAGANWLKWSKIGALDFTIDRSNVAGQMPLPLRGSLYAIMQHGADIIVYGRNGVYKLIPSNTAFGQRSLLTVGLKSKLAVVDIGPTVGGTHYFVDALGRLWKFAEGLELLDYREWLSGLGTVALSFNADTRLLYICDGTTGYVYNVDTGSMGKGPATVTGVQVQGSTLYVVQSGTMTIANFQIVTDITDLGSRKGKSITSLEVGVDTTLTLQGAVEYRLKKQSAFSTTNWYTIDSRGQVFIPCFGYEFRFKIKATAAGWFHLDSLKVNGWHHAH